MLLFLVSGYMFPLSVVTTEEWENSHGVLWKLFYMMPIFFNFRMRIYAGFTLSECACIMSDDWPIRDQISLIIDQSCSGLGAYPECSDPRPGQGPSKPEMLTTAGQSQLEKINFETVEKIINYWNVINMYKFYYLGSQYWWVGQWLCAKYENTTQFN